MDHKAVVWKAFRLPPRLRGFILEGRGRGRGVVSSKKVLPLGEKALNDYKEG